MLKIENIVFPEGPHGFWKTHQFYSLHLKKKTEQEREKERKARCRGKCTRYFVRLQLLVALCQALLLLLLFEKQSLHCVTSHRVHSYNNRHQCQAFYNDSLVSFHAILVRNNPVVQHSTEQLCAWQQLCDFSSFFPLCHVVKYLQLPCNLPSSSLVQSSAAI